MALRHFLLAVAGAAAFSCVTHAQVVAPNYKDSTGQARSAQGMVCLTSSGAECAFGSGGGTSTPTGSAGSPNAAVVTVQGIAGGTNQNVAVQSSVLPTGASTSANQSTIITTLGTISGQLPASLGAKAAASSLSISPATDALFPATGVYNSTGLTLTNGQSGNIQLTSKGWLGVSIFNSAGTNTPFLGAMQDAIPSSTIALGTVSFGVGFNGTNWDQLRTVKSATVVDGSGVSAIAVAPTSAAYQAIAPVSAAGTATSVLKASAGNVYGFNLVNNTTAIFAIVLDAATAPASGTALTTANIKYCFPVAASAGFDKVFSPPVRVTSGATLLASTSCTTYTTPATLPVVLIGMAQ